MSEMQSGVQQAWQARLDAGEFVIQRCGGCQQHVFYPRGLCPHCGADQLVFVTPAGSGTVYATTVVRRKAELGGDYNVVLVDLDEGVRLMSRVEGVAPDAVAIGLRVQARVAREQDRGLLLFDPL